MVKLMECASCSVKPEYNRLHQFCDMPVINGCD